MKETDRIESLAQPAGPIRAVIDTDTYNEVDDQFALAYLLRSPEHVQVEAIYAAPFLNEKVQSANEGMEKSYDEILRVLELTGVQHVPAVLHGAGSFLDDGATSVLSEAAEDLIQRARAAAEPIYVIGIAAATNIASAILAAPDIIDHIVVVWLGGSALHRPGEAEFNLMEDYRAAKVLFESGVPLVQIPCWGVAEHFTISRAELEKDLMGHGKLADYLAKIVIREADGWAPGGRWSKTIWDVTAAGWLLNHWGGFMEDMLLPTPVPQEDHSYSFFPGRPMMRYVYKIDRDALMNDLIDKITEG